MEQLVIYLLMVQKLLLKTKDFETVTTPLCLRNISEGYSADNMEKKSRIIWICLQF